MYFLAQQRGIVAIKQINSSLGLELQRLLAFLCFSPPNPPPCLPCFSGQNRREFFDSSLSLTPTYTHVGKSSPFCFLRGEPSASHGPGDRLCLPLLTPAHPVPHCSSGRLVTVEPTPTPLPPPVRRAHRKSPLHSPSLPRSTRTGTTAGHWRAIPAWRQAHDE